MNESTLSPDALAPADPTAVHRRLADAAMGEGNLSPDEIILLGVHCAHACPAPGELQSFIRAAERYLGAVRVLPEAKAPPDGIAPDGPAFDEASYAAPAAQDAAQLPPGESEVGNTHDEAGEPYAGAGEPVAANPGPADPTTATDL